MRFVADKIFMYDDYGAEQFYYELQSSKPREINLELGETQLIFDDKMFTKTKDLLIRKPLFPENKINPIHHSDLNRNSLIIVRLDFNSLLYDSILRPMKINVELKISSEKRLTYLFFGFEKINTFTLKAKKIQDDYSLIQTLKKDLLNTKLRQYMIDLMLGMESHPSQSGYVKHLNKLSIEDTTVEKLADYRIEYRASSFDVFFGKDYIINLPKLHGIQLIVYKLKNPEIDDPLMIEKALFDRNETNIIKAFARCEKNFRNAIIKIEELERKNNLTKTDRFSKYVDDSIDFKEHNSQILFHKAYQKNWDFKYFPPNFNPLG